MTGSEPLPAAIPVDESEGAQERVLGDVFGQCAVAGEVPCEPEHLGLIEADQLLERAQIACPRQLDRPWIRVAHR